MLYIFFTILHSIETRILSASTEMSKGMKDISQFIKPFSGRGLPGCEARRRRGFPPHSYPLGDFLLLTPLRFAF